MVRYKEKAKRKLYVEEEVPPPTMNEYGVRIRGLPVLSSKIKVPPPSAKRRRSGVGASTKEKDKEKVSVFTLPLTDLVGVRVEIHPSKDASTSNESSSHMHDFIPLVRNPCENVGLVYVVVEDIRVIDKGIVNELSVPMSVSA